jgi:pimeloyl-ACP methyl ester carboxylesterase
MLAPPSRTTVSPRYRPMASVKTPGGSLGRPAAHRHRLDAKRDGWVERTVATSDGVRLAVREYGTVDAEHTVVLLHGLCLTQESWAAQIRQLIRQWGNTIRIITYDHRGHGRSADASMRTYRIDRLATDLAEVLTALRVEGPLTLAGHSMGGMTALAYLGRPTEARPVEPQGLVLIATAAGKIAERGIGRLLATPATRMLFELVHHMPGGVTERAIKALVRPICEAITRYPGEASTERNALAAVAAGAVSSTALTTAAGFLPSLKRFDQYQTISSITANTVIVSGGADVLTPASHAHDLLAAIPGASHVHRPTAGHMLLQEAPRCISTAIDSAMGMQRRDRSA